MNTQYDALRDYFANQDKQQQTNGSVEQFTFRDQGHQTANYAQYNENFTIPQETVVQKCKSRVTQVLLVISLIFIVIIAYCLWKRNSSEQKPVQNTIVSNRCQGLQQFKNCAKNMQSMQARLNLKKTHNPHQLQDSDLSEHLTNNGQQKVDQSSETESETTIEQTDHVIIEEQTQTESEEEDQIQKMIDQQTEINPEQRDEESLQ